MFFKRFFFEQIDNNQPTNVLSSNKFIAFLNKFVGSHISFLPPKKVSAKTSGVVMFPEY